MNCDQRSMLCHHCKSGKKLHCFEHFIQLTTMEELKEHLPCLALEMARPSLFQCSICTYRCLSADQKKRHYEICHESTNNIVCNEVPCCSGPSPSMEISNSPDISSQVSDGIDKTNGNNVTPILTEVINKEGEDKRLVVSGNRVTVDLAVKFHNSLQDALTLPPSENVSIPETKQLQVTYCSTNSSIDCSVDIDLTSEESEFHSLNALCPTGGLSEQKDAIIRLVPNKTAIIERRAKSLSPSRNSADACPVDVDMTVENSTGALVSTLDSSTNDCLESRPAVQSPSNATSHVEETGASSSLRMDPSGNDKLVRVQPNTNILSDPVLRNQSSSTDACPFCGIKRLTHILRTTQISKRDITFPLLLPRRDGWMYLYNNFRITQL